MHPLLIVASVGHDVGLGKLLAVGIDVNIQHPQVCINTGQILCYNG